MSVISTTLGQRAIPSTEDSYPSAADLKRGESATQIGLASDAPPALTRRLFDLGFIPGARIERLRRAVLGDPTIYRVNNVEVALRQQEARCILVER